MGKSVLDRMMLAALVLVGVLVVSRALGFRLGVWARLCLFGVLSFFVLGGVGMCFDKADKMLHEGTKEKENEEVEDLERKERVYRKINRIERDKQCPYCGSEMVMRDRILAPNEEIGHYSVDILMKCRDKGCCNLNYFGLPLSKKEYDALKNEWNGFRRWSSYKNNKSVADAEDVKEKLRRLGYL